VSFAMMARVAAISHLLPSPKEGWVLMHLADQYFDDTQRCSPTIDYLALKTKFSRMSVVRAVERLEADQWIGVDRRYGSKLSFTLKLDAQLRLRPKPVARTRRKTGFAVRRGGRKSGGQPEANPYQGDMGLPLAAEGEPITGCDRLTDQPGDFSTGGPITGCDRNRSQAVIGSGATRTSVPIDLSVQPQPRPTAPAQPGLPMPLGVRTDERAKVEAAYWKSVAERRVCGLAIGLLAHPERGIPLIQEPVTTIETLTAATKALAAQRGVRGYGDVVHPMCASVWWKRTVYGQAVLANLAPRPRDLRADPARYTTRGTARRPQPRL
jgi:hypothetical protein